MRERKRLMRSTMINLEVLWLRESHRRRRHVAILGARKMTDEYSRDFLLLY